MFIHAFSYAFRQSLREKTALFWNLCFPIILGTLFYIAFSGLSDEESFHAIPVAVVLEDESADTAFSETIKALSKTDEEQLLEATITSKAHALTLLENKDVIGILYEGSPVTLTVSSEMSTFKLEQSILNAFIEQYNMNIHALEDIAGTNPQNLLTALELLEITPDYHTETSFSDGNLDESLSYFFNLIAMVCLYAYMGGISVVTNSQANLSALGARKCISPVRKMVSLFGELSAQILYHFLCNLMNLMYLIFILKVDFGNKFGFILLASFTGCITGVSLGFFVGAFGKMSQSTKFGVMMAVSMICCFLSGLMAGGMRLIVEKVCPWFNHINPAALISDSFYSLTVYQSNDRFFQNILLLLLLSAGFYLGGLILIRRKKYAAL